MEAQLLRLLLNYNFYKDNKHRFLPEYFEGNLSKLYQLITDCHEKHKKDVSIAELKALFKSTYPATTRAQWELLEQVIDNIPPELSDEISKEILSKAYIQELGRQVSNLGISICNGEEANFQKITEILQTINKGSVSDGELQQVSSELEDILEALSVTTRWAFNLAPLCTVASGLGNGIFCIASARTEVGKTAFGVSICAAPGGFADQGALCHYYVNEESPLRTQGRAVMSWTGRPIQDILLNKEETKKEYEAVRERLRFFDCRGKSIHEIERHVDRTAPDIIVVDQLDKLKVSGTYAREDERLGSLYVATRDIGANYNCGIIAITQLNADAEGKTYIASNNLAGSRTAKAAEGDLVLGIGKTPDHNDPTRIINVIKNKLNGNHTDIVCIIRPEISRYVS